MLFVKQELLTGKIITLCGQNVQFGLEQLRPVVILRFEQEQSLLLHELYLNARLWNTCSVVIRSESYKIDTQYFAKRIAIIYNAYVLDYLYGSTVERGCMLYSSGPFTDVSVNL